MSEKHDKHEAELEDDELDEQDAELLPNREAMSVLESPLTPDSSLITDPWPDQ
jgi:hypothetical protein